jgi:hypothetical protein
MVAVSASRRYVMEEYNLESEACDYRLIRINNCIQCFACLCQILAIIDENFRQLSQIINLIADLVYHSVSGCMTAQVAYEIDYQEKVAMSMPSVVVAQPVTNPMLRAQVHDAVVKY